MDRDYYQYIKGWFGKWAWFYNFIALPLTGVRNKVADLVDEEYKDKIKILDVWYLKETSPNLLGCLLHSSRFYDLHLNRRIDSRSRNKAKFESRCYWHHFG